MNTATLPKLPPADKELLQREVCYRLSYRGTLELDHICRAALAHVPQLSEIQLTELRDFLLHKEGDLMAWLVDGLAPPTDQAPMVNRLKGWFLATRQG